MQLSFPSTFCKTFCTFHLYTFCTPSVRLLYVFCTPSAHSVHVWTLHKPYLEAARKAIAESECMTRAVYARCLRVLLDSDEIDGQDVLHIISSSKGGADHPDNYLYAPSYTSGRPLAVVGDYDSLTAFAAGKAKAVKAIRVSRIFGNRISPDHDVIDAKGKAVKY